MLAPKLGCRCDFGRVAKELAGQGHSVIGLRDAEECFGPVGVRLQVFEGGRVAVRRHAREPVNGGIPQRRQHLRGVARPHPAGVLAERHVPHVVQLVLDRPVVPHERPQAFRSRLVGGQAGDGVRHLHLDRPLHPPLAPPFDPLFQPRPLRPGGEDGRGPQRPHFPPSVPLVHRRRNPLRRRRPGRSRAGVRSGRCRPGGCGPSAWPGRPCPGWRTAGAAGRAGCAGRGRWPVRRTESGRPCGAPRELQTRHRPARQDE